MKSTVCRTEHYKGFLGALWSAFAAQSSRDIESELMTISSNSKSDFENMRGDWERVGGSIYESIRKTKPATRQH